MKTNHPTAAPNFFELAGDIRSGKGSTGEKLESADRISRVLLEGTEGAPDNYKLGYSATEGEGGKDWTSPRHRHNFEQIRYPLEGDFYITKDEVLPAGWVAYFPESAFYGPQIKSANLKMVVLQMGGPSGFGYASVRQQGMGFDALLAKGGVIDDGIYTWTDESGARHRQDASEAAWEEIFERKVVYPPPRYDKCIAMNPENFAWMKSEEESGVAFKRLGTFTERDVRIALVRVEKGATFTFGTQPSEEVLFLSTGALRHGDVIHERLDAFGTAPTDSPERLEATEDAELLYVKLATF